jgi:hypothetical protein
MSEVGKLKEVAKNKKLHYWERMKATDTLGELGTKEALLALLEIAGDDGLYYWERELALSKAREIIRKTREKSEI